MRPNTTQCPAFYCRKIVIGLLNMYTNMHPVLQRTRCQERCLAGLLQRSVHVQFFAVSPSPLNGIVPYLNARAHWSCAASVAWEDLR